MKYYALFLNAYGYAHVEKHESDTEAEAISHFEEIEHNLDQWIMMSDSALEELKSNIEEVLCQDKQ